MPSTAFMRWQIPERYLKLPELTSASQVPPPSSCGSTAPPTAAQDPPTGLDRILTPPLSVQAPPTPRCRSQAPPLPPVQSPNGLFPAIHESQRGPKTVPSAEQRGGLTGLHKDSRPSSKDGGSLVKPGTAVETAPSVADKENTSGAGGSQQNLMGPQSPGSVQRLPPDPLKSAAPRFFRLRLLTPNTRAQRHLYQTWHSLPERHCGDPGNQGSMFTVLHRSQAASFTIHPEWV
ncbi:proline-rich receptor-like protein kinase PERK14 isoform X1 [Acipenser oxyrinchus oxyrinchus]|uniref:Proline-rich receptor-like protein kinase PERK14 isoform X1 n=1 Tax=Acipenser oxyrinchus oxyrinchus TaxID=40147 RepID=A0AAD8FU50_ACIOX|nr:proline-rich receptor-like protein kinase PERK14 isoform X1 [Acipenser oxyrinchus oxyrinchus]